MSTTKTITVIILFCCSIGILVYVISVWPKDAQDSPEPRAEDPIVTEQPVPQTPATPADPSPQAPPPPPLVSPPEENDASPDLPDLPRFSSSLPVGTDSIDPTFGTRIRRLSDAEAEGVTWITHAYSSVSPFNADSTLVLLEKSGGILHVRDLEGRIIRDNLHTAGIVPLGDPLWSRTDPKIIYFHTADGNEIKSYNVVSGEVTTLSVVESFQTIRFGNGEGDISWDGSRIPILADDQYGFVYTIPTDSISPAVDMRTRGSVDVIDVTPEHRMLLLTFDPSATWMVSEGTDTPVKLLDYGGHSDRGRDKTGEDVLVVTNSADPTPIPNCPNGIVKVTLETAKETCLQPLDWDLAVHISCNNIGQDWCIVSTYSALEPSSTNPLYTNEILKVPLDGGGSTRLGKTYSTNETYVNIPRAAVSPNGKYVLFASDLQGDIVDVYLLFVPATVSSGRSSSNV